MSLDAEQRTNAATIIAVGKKLGASTRDQLVALMTALQESSLRNLPGGDRDSVGLFQQRNAWGTFAQRHDPAQAAAMFYTGGHGGQRGLFDFKNRDRMSLTQEAQSVQVSAFPNAYAKWQDEASGLLKGGGGSAGGLSVGGVLGSAASSVAGAVTAPARLGAKLLGKGADAAGGAVADAAGGAASAAVGGLAGDLADTAGRVLLIGTGVVAGAGLVLLGLNRMTGDPAGKSRHAAVALAPLAL